VKCRTEVIFMNKLRKTGRPIVWAAVSEEQPVLSVHIIRYEMNAHLGDNRSFRWARNMRFRTQWFYQNNTLAHTGREFLCMLLQLLAHFQVKCIPHVCAPYSSHTVECRTKFLCKPPWKFMLTELQKHITRNNTPRNIIRKIFETLNK
jgi:hypothetical protein